ncbi:MAG: adenylyltransferase/cytidyltransferase family protein [Endozoicomonas sp.]
MRVKAVCVSGGFDPMHVGHLRMMQQAALFGELTVIVNSDEWLMRKKGYVFMPFTERCELLRGLGCVVRTSAVDDSDGSVVEALKRIKPDYFANGGDRKPASTPELQLCKSLGIEALWGIGGDKVQSSSELVNNGKAFW